MANPISLLERAHDRFLNFPAMICVYFLWNKYISSVSADTTEKNNHTKWEYRCMASKDILISLSIIKNN